MTPVTARGGQFPLSGDPLGRAIESPQGCDTLDSRVRRVGVAFVYGAWTMVMVGLGEK